MEWIQHAIMESRQLGIEFCILYLGIGHALLDHADITCVEELRRRNIAAARCVRRTVMELIRRPAARTRRASKSCSRAPAGASPSTGAAP